MRPLHMRGRLASMRKPPLQSSACCGSFHRQHSAVCHACFFFAKHHVPPAPVTTGGRCSPTAASTSWSAGMCVKPPGHSCKAHHSHAPRPGPRRLPSGTRARKLAHVRARPVGAHHEPRAQPPPARQAQLGQRRRRGAVAACARCRVSAGGPAAGGLDMPRQLRAMPATG